MKTLVVYDSAFGNTRLIAESIGHALSGESRVLSVKEAKAAEVAGVDRLIVGSPTQAGKATAGVNAFLATFPPSALIGVKVAAFDTRLASRLAGILGYAAGKILSQLTRKGGTEIAAAEGFIVRGQKGPLQADELERAAEWAKSLDGNSSGTYGNS